MQRNGTATKERIERQALRLFVEKGVTATTVRDITAASGVTEAALYRHFASKDELAWRVFFDNFSAFAAELDEIQNEHGTLRGKLGGIIRHFCQAFDRDWVLFSYLLISEHEQVTKVTKEMPNPVQVLREVIAKGIARGEVPDQDPELATSMVLGIVLQVARSHVYGRIEGNLSRLADNLVEATWRVLQC
ncbi:MAG: TetR/AcrR family transcriptional regulator [Alphaproteobacteria bacterium]